MTTITDTSIRGNRWRYFYGLVFSGILLYGWLIRAYGLFEPWASGHMGTAGARFSLQALNFVRYGYWATGFRPILNAGWVTPEEYILYGNHPPLISVLISLSFRIFGVHEWSARLVPIVFSMALIILIYLLAYDLWSSARIALLSAGFAAIIPVGAYYGQHVSDQGALLLFSLLLAVYFYWKYYQSPQGKYLVGLTASVLFALLTDWQGLYIVILLACHHLFYGHIRRDWRFWAFVCICSLLFLFFVYYFIGWEFFLFKLQQRTSSQLSDAESAETFTMLQWTRRIGGRILQGYTIPILGLGIFWGLSQLVRLFKERRIAATNSFVLILLSFGAMQLFIGRQAAWVHDYRVEYFIPGLALAAAWATDYLTTVFVRQTGWSRLALVANVGLLIILVAHTTSITLLRHWSHENLNVWADFGRAIAQNSEFEAQILTSARVPSQLSYYADRNLVQGITSRVQFETALLSCAGKCRYFFAPLNFPLYPNENEASIIPSAIANSSAYEELLIYLGSQYETKAGEKYLLFYLDH